jgi:hypothetical protein
LENQTFTFAAELWRHSGPAPWHFLTLPEDVADEICDVAAPRPFGTVRAEVTVGSTTWSTSLFADRKLGSYVLPVKAEVRKAADLAAGDTVSCRIRLVE